MNPESFDANLISDGYHTFGELYDFRKLYNAVLFNEWAAQGKYKVHKSLRHSDGKRLADDFGASDDGHEVFFNEGIDDFTGINAADGFDFGLRYRLKIADNRERLECSLGKSSAGLGLE